MKPMYKTSKRGRLHMHGSESFGKVVFEKVSFDIRSHRFTVSQVTIDDSHVKIFC